LGAIALYYIALAGFSLSSLISGSRFLAILFYNPEAVILKGLAKHRELGDPE
jgi:hypothetical protein